MPNLWVDDMRRPPDGWAWAKTSKEALEFLAEQTYDTVSLDHDLGLLPDDEMMAHCDAVEARGEKLQDHDFVDTTRPIVMHWCENGGWPETVLVHSSNPVGVEWLTGMINRYKP